MASLEYSDPPPSYSPDLVSFPDDGISFAPPVPPHSLRDAARATRITIAHPYARLYAKKDGSKRRKIWNHALEKSLFSPHEL